MGWEYGLNELADIMGAEAPATAARFNAISTDTRTLAPGQVFFALKGRTYDGNHFVREAFARGALAAVAAAPVAGKPCLVVADPLAALQCFAAYHRRRYSLPLIAVTGSCGKTMAKDLIAAVLGAKFCVAKTHGNLNNEIGCPLSLLEMDCRTDMAVIEMGANHPGEIAGLCALAQPTEAAVTMVGPAHLEGFGSVENVANAKAEIVAGLPQDGVFYVNADDEWCVRIGQRFSGRKVRFGSAGDVALNACHVEPDGEMTLEVSPVGRLRLPLAVKAHGTNVLLAIAVGMEHGVSEFEAPLRKACLESSRMRVFRIGQIEVLDDSYNANPSSMAAALEALADRPGTGARLAALGEMLELGSAARDLHRHVGVLAARNGVRRLFACGPHAADMVDAAREAGVPHGNVIEEPRAMAEAIRAAAKPGDVLLLKGSRGMRMERVLKALQVLYERPDADRRGPAAANGLG